MSEYFLWVFSLCCCLFVCLLLCVESTKKRSARVCARQQFITNWRRFPIDTLNRASAQLSRNTVCVHCTHVCVVRTKETECAREYVVKCLCVASFTSCVWMDRHTRVRSLFSFRCGDWTTCNRWMYWERESERNRRYTPSLCRCADWERERETKKRELYLNCDAVQMTWGQQGDAFHTELNVYNSHHSAIIRAFYSIAWRICIHLYPPYDVDDGRTLHYTILSFEWFRGRSGCDEMKMNVSPSNVDDVGTTHAPWDCVCDA